MDLPVFALKDELISALDGERTRVLLRAPTGSGKSTGVPPILAEAGLTERGTLLIVQPRRMAARLLARRVAELRQSPLGEEVGYIVRFEQKHSSRTKILFITDGILERLILDNPTLQGISGVIFDEFHERRLTGDLCLARLLSLQEEKRPDLVLFVMSATLEISGLEDYLSPCTTLEASGKMYPVECLYTPPKPINDGRGRSLAPPIWESVTAVARDAIKHSDHGDILIFLPGSYEIRRTSELLERAPHFKNFDIFPLYGTLPPDKQNAAVTPGKKAKIIVSTNVAETSLTIDGLRTVIDSGLARVAARDPKREIDTLTIKKISRSSADQRAGRAGRTAPGRCYRLWSEADHARRPEFELPEVLRVDLSNALLAMSSWGIRRPAEFRWLTPPEELSLTRAGNLLLDLDAVDKEGGITATGKQMLGYPLSPRLARLLVAGIEHACLPEAAFIAALIQGEGVFLKAGDIPERFRDKDDYTDFQPEARAATLAEQSKFDPSTCTKYGVLARGAREVWNSYEQLLRLTASNNKLSYIPAPDFPANKNGLTTALIETFSDHIGARNGIAANTCRLVGGKRGKLPSGSTAFRDIAFVATEISEIEGKTMETKVSRCTTISPEAISLSFPNHWTEKNCAIYDDSKRRVVRKHLQVFRDLIITEQEKGDPTTEEAAPLLAAKVADGTLRLNKWDDAVDQWIIRLNALREWMPELELPTFTEEDRVVAFSILCEKALGYKDIKDREVIPVLKEWLSGWQRDALSRYAPTQLSLPNGQHPKVRYDERGTPRIALTVQRLYDINETPTIADGRVPVTVEILAPNQRPWQVTSNLKSFWETGYPQMKKDLAARYPKHKWR